MPARIKPTQADLLIARANVRHTNPPAEQISQFVTWGGGHLNGVPLTGNARDAFPSGHAVHIGALASAATRLPAAQRNVVWAAGAGLVLTRVILLAHWASDVVAGIAIGAALERALRPVTGFGRMRSLKSHV
jgi:membrane-associated phospholipid phosphatase